MCAQTTAHTKDACSEETPSLVTPQFFAIRYETYLMDFLFNHMLKFDEEKKHRKNSIYIYISTLLHYCLVIQQYFCNQVHISCLLRSAFLEGGLRRRLKDLLYFHEEDSYVFFESVFLPNSFDKVLW